MIPVCWWRAGISSSLAAARAQLAAGLSSGRSGSCGIIELTLCSGQGFIALLLLCRRHARHVDCCSDGPAHESSFASASMLLSFTGAMSGDTVILRTMSQVK
jgi:hypothetical protein